MADPVCLEQRDQLSGHPAGPIARASARLAIGEYVFTAYCSPGATMRGHHETSAFLG
jgi:hypothetical protein